MEEYNLRFVPSSVKGLSSVTEVAVFPDRLELLSEGKWIVIPFLQIARGVGVRGRPYVADRNCFHPPPRRFFRFYTNPQITIYMPDESPELEYSEKTFHRVCGIIRKGGFTTIDLG